MKIMQISDLHFGSHRSDILQAFMQELKIHNPEIVLITGDITQRARASQFQQAHDFINNISGLVFCVPGNHDIPLANLFARLFYPFDHYRKYISSSLQTRFENKEVKILGVNSADPKKIKDGTLSPRTLAMIKKYFAKNTAQFKILFFHHNFSYFEGLHKPLTNEAEIIAYLKTSPIDLVCTGHLHYANINKLQREDGKQCTLLHAGSLLCDRTRDQVNSYYLIHLENRSCQIEWRVFEKNQFVTAQAK